MGDPAKNQPLLQLATRGRGRPRSFPDLQELAQKKSKVSVLVLEYWRNSRQNSASDPPFSENEIVSMKSQSAMQLGMVGLGRMGANMVRRLIKGSCECVVYDRAPQSVGALVEENAVGANSPARLVSQLAKPRAVWLMVPAALV